MDCWSLPALLDLGLLLLLLLALLLLLLLLLSSQRRGAVQVVVGVVPQVTEAAQSAWPSRRGGRGTGTASAS